MDLEDFERIRKEQKLKKMNSIKDKVKAEIIHEINADNLLGLNDEGDDHHT